jgi:hypothetical protein
MINGNFRRFTLFFVFAALVVVLTACSGGDSLAGTYVCTEHWSMDELVGKLTLELRDDGTFVMTPPGSEGTYEAADGVVTLAGDIFPSGLDLQIEGNSLRSPSDLGDTVYTKE